MYLRLHQETTNTPTSHPSINSRTFDESDYNDQTEIKRSVGFDPNLLRADADSVGQFEEALTHMQQEMQNPNQ